MRSQATGMQFMNPHNLWTGWKPILPSLNPTCGDRIADFKLGVKDIEIVHIVEV